MKLRSPRRGSRILFRVRLAYPSHPVPCQVSVISHPSNPVPCQVSVNSHPDQCQVRFNADQCRGFQKDPSTQEASHATDSQMSSKPISEEFDSAERLNVPLASKYHKDKEDVRWYTRIPLPTIEPTDPLAYPYECEEDMESELEHRRLALLAAIREQETAHARELQAGNADLAEMSGRNLAHLNKSVASLEDDLYMCSGSLEAFESEGPQNRDIHLRKVEVADSESVLQTRIVPLSEVVANLQDWKDALGCELDSLVSEHQACVVKTEEDVRKMESDSLLEVVRVPGKVVAVVKPPNRKKARLVACGNFLYQSKGRGSPSLNRRDLYAAGLDVYSMRCQIAIGAFRKWRCASLDVKTAFLTAPLQTPKNANERKRKVLVRASRVMSMCNLLPANSWLEVQGALYGLRESPSSWGVSRDEKLRSLTWKGANGTPKHLQQCVSDVSLWLVKDSESDRCIGTLGVYVDDLMFWTEPLELEGILAAVQRLWKCSKPEYADQEGGLTFCGVEIEQDGLETRVHQRTYLQELLKRYESPRPSTALPEFRSDPAEETLSADGIHAAQKIVGELTWLAGRSRPDIGYSVNKLIRMVSKYPVSVKENGLQVLKYLAFFTQDWSLVYGSQVSYPQEFMSELPMSRSQLVLEAWADASFAQNEGKSQTGLLLTLSGGPIAWLSIQQPYTALSTCESELIACSEGLTLSEALRPLICELAQETVPWSFMNDSVSANAVLSFPAGSWRTRHLRVRCNAFHEHLEEGEMVLNHIAGRYMLGDLLTKTLSFGRIKDLMRCMGSKGTGLHVSPTLNSDTSLPSSAAAIKLLVVSWSVVPVNAQGRGIEFAWKSEGVVWSIVGLAIVFGIISMACFGIGAGNRVRRLRVLADRQNALCFVNSATQP